jgi:hypothetical protein
LPLLAKNMIPGTPMHHDKIAEEISAKSFWNTIRWGWRDFGSEADTIIDSLLKHREGVQPEFFLVGAAAVDEVKQSGLFQATSESGVKIGYIRGLPVYVTENMPPDLIAVIAPGSKLFPGEPKYEVTHNQASWLLIQGSHYRDIPANRSE